MTQYIDIIDYLLLPVYLYLFYILVRRRSVKYTDNELRKIFFTAFFLRMFGSVAYSMMIQYYYGYGDSFTYYHGSDFLVKQVYQDFSNIRYFFAPADDVGNWYNFESDEKYYTGYMGTVSNLFVMKLAALVSMVSFNKFLIISLFFALFAFAGQWRLFLVFNDINKGKNLNLLAFAVLYTPSIWFWGSGLMKDSVCLGATGFIIAILYKNFVKLRFSFRDMFYLVVLAYIVFIIKSYIILILAVSLSIILVAKFIASVKNILLKSLIILTFFFSTAVIAFVSNFADQLQTLAKESKQQVDTYQKNYDATREETEDSKGTLEITEVEASIGGMILHAPVAIFTCLFRPFIWESHKVIILFTSLETTLLLFATLYLLYCTRVWGFFRIILGNEYILFCLMLSLAFALVIGFTTYNFGTMARYKIIFLPFLYFMMVYIFSHYKKGPVKEIVV